MLHVMLHNTRTCTCTSTTFMIAMLALGTYSVQGHILERRDRHDNSQHDNSQQLIGVSTTVWGKW